MEENAVIFDANEDSKETKVNDSVDSTMAKVEYSEDDILSREIRMLLESYSEILSVQSKTTSDQNINVSEVLGSVAFLYERARNAVDYKGEHLLKRNAIERILKRQIWERPKRDPFEHATSLIRELIWARYVPNDSIPKNKAGEIAEIISKYLSIYQLVSDAKENGEFVKPGELREWFLGVISCEIEEVLDPLIYYIDTLNYPVYLWLKKHFNWQDEDLGEKDKDIQLFIAVHRSLPKSDEPRIRYHLLRAYYPDWRTVNEEQLESVINEIFEIRKEIETQISSPIQPRIYRFVQRQSAAFLILKEVVEENIDQIEKLLKNEDKLEKTIRDVCIRRYDEIRKRVNRGILRSVIYIFTSKVFFALLIEIPYETVFIGQLNMVALSINTIIPPSLMFLVGLTIKRPDEANTERIIGKIKSFVYKKKDKEKIKFSLVTNKRGGLMFRIFVAIYALLFLITFAGLTSILASLGFNFLSGVIFFVFLSLILLFGYRVRFTATELSVKGEKERLISHLFTNITLPFLNLGVWISESFSRFNFLIVLMDFLIETPLKHIIRVFEEWTSFIREKREEVVEVPTSG